MKHRYGLFTVLTAVFLAAVSAKVQAADQTSSGYWKYARYEVLPKPEDIPKSMPGRLFEQRSNGDVDIAAGSIQNACVWNTDNVDLKAFTMASTFVVRANRTLAYLIPKEKLTLSGSVGVTGNALAASLPAGGNYTAGIGNGEVFQIKNVRIGQSVSGQGTIEVPGGGPGAEAILWINSFLASYGAFGGRVQLIYHWVVGTPPAGGGSSGGTAPPASGGGTGAGAGSGGGTRSGAGGGAGTGPGGGGRPGSEMVLRADSVKATSGTTIAVPIYLDNSSGLANMNFNVVYESKVAEAGNPVKGAMLPSQMMMVPNAGTSGLVRIGLAGPNNITGSGTIVQIPFKAVGRPGVTTVLKLEITTVRSASGSIPPLRTINGLIEIVGAAPPGGSGGAPGSGGGGGTPPGSGGGGGKPGPGTAPGGAGGLLGDANGNGQIEAIDALQALKMSVGLIPENLICDMDKDGKVTSTDARLILAKAIGK